MADENPLLEQTKTEAHLDAQKIGSELFRSIWLYFGVPPGYNDKIRVLNGKPLDKEFIHFISKAAVVDILRNRDVHGLLFEIVFHRCNTLGNDVLHDLDTILCSLIANHDHFSAFIRFLAILSDFILFLRCKRNFLNLDRQRLMLYWSDFYEAYFEKKIMNLGGLEALKNAARTKARIYPHSALQNFISKHCSPEADYNKENIPTYFQFIHEKYAYIDFNYH